MTITLKQFLLPLLAALGAAGGVLLRRREEATAFEPGTGLPVAGSPSTVAVLGFSLGVVLVLLVISLVFGRKTAARAENAALFHCQSYLYLLFFFCAGLLCLAGAFFAFREGYVFPRNYLELVFGVFALFAAFCFCLLGKANYEERYMERSLCYLMPGFLNCIWLMYSYRAWARDPDVRNYTFALFAVMAGMLAHYYIASFSFGRPHAGCLLFCASTAVFCSAVAVVSNTSAVDRCLFAAQILYFLPLLVVLVGNRLQPPFFHTYAEPYPSYEDTEQ
jgi:hypothetical protein